MSKPSAAAGDVPIDDGREDVILVPNVAPSKTVPPEVKWENRHSHDKIWACLYILAFSAFIGCGATIWSRAHPRYEFVEIGDESSGSSETIRVVSDYFRDDVAQCCAMKNSRDYYSYDLCGELNAENWLRNRRLQENDSLLNSKLQPGDGMFDAFLEAPWIPAVMSFLAFFLAVTWIVLIRFFATPIVFGTQAIKVAFFLYLGLAHGVFIVPIVIALAIIAWDIYTWKKLIFAGKILSYAAQSFKENMLVFFAFIPILALYAINAYLFVVFWSKSFEVVEVVYREEYDECFYESPSYVSGMVGYISLVYLWSIVLFSMMRLSIIANVIGSWHFHRENTPSIGRAIWNTCTTSMGTISVASLFVAIAEKINQALAKKMIWTACFNPIACIACLIGQCIGEFIRMLTKFCVILHVFSNKSWLGSAKKVYKILKRHFLDGFVTEYASANVLAFGSFAFSIAIYIITWVWLDQEFNTKTFDFSDFGVVLYLLFALFNLWYPVLGLFLLITISRYLSNQSSSSLEDDDWYEDDLQVPEWVVPFAATFVGCISMMFFTFLAGVFLDTVDVLFLCFAIDRDNRVDISGNEFAKLIQEGVETVITEPDWSNGEPDWSDDEEEEPTKIPMETSEAEEGNPPLSSLPRNNNEATTSMGKKDSDDSDDGYDV